MEEVKINISGINAKFENAGDLHRLRTARPDLFKYAVGGILMFLNEQSGEWLRVILPIRDEDLIGIRQVEAA